MRKQKLIGCLCAVGLMFMFSCGVKDIKHAGPETLHAVSSYGPQKLETKAAEKTSSQNDDYNILFVSESFERALRLTHSYVSARTQCGEILFLIPGKNPSIFTGGNELDFLGTGQELKIVRDNGIDKITLPGKGTFRSLGCQFSNENINRYLVHTIFDHRLYRDGPNVMEIKDDTIRINGTEVGYLLYLGFNMESIDTIYQRKGISFFLQLQGNKADLYATNPDDYSFGKRGNLLMTLKAAD